MSRKTWAEIEAALLVSEPESGASDASRAYREALEVLRESDVRFCLLRDDPAALHALRDLDLLVHPLDWRLAAAALERAGFLPRYDRRLRKKQVFLRFESGCFRSLDVHGAFVQNGIEYMRAVPALARLDRTAAVPRLCDEDLFLHVLLHNLLGKPELQPKHRALLDGLVRRGLNGTRLVESADWVGGERFVDEVLSGWDAVVSDPVRWRSLRRRLRGRLLRRPANQIGAWRYRHGDRLRLRRRPVVLALLGPDGSGKTTFADTLQEMLKDSPLRPGRVYMGCWGHDLLLMRQARRLTPQQISFARLFWRACKLPIPLRAEERAYAVAHRLRPLALGLASLRQTIKDTVFGVSLLTELGYRYARHIALSRRPIVLTDRYVYDLEFRHGKVPYERGAFVRKCLYRFFPAPDGILYLTTSYDLVAVRKPQLDRESFVVMDRVFRRVLARHRPLEIASDVPPGELAQRFLTQHWERVLARCNRRA